MFLFVVVSFWWVDFPWGITRYTVIRYPVQQHYSIGFLGSEQQSCVCQLEIGKIGGRNMYTNFKAPGAQMCEGNLSLHSKAELLTLQCGLCSGLIFRIRIQFYSVFGCMKLIWRIIDTTSANPFILWICSQISTRKVEIDILTGETQVNSFDLVYASWMGTEKSKNNILELIILKNEIIPLEIHLNWCWHCWSRAVSRYPTIGSLMNWGFWQKFEPCSGHRPDRGQRNMQTQQITIYRRQKRAKNATPHIPDEKRLEANILNI